MCRGPGWDQNGWPKFAGGSFSLDDCVAACDSMTGCTGFDLGFNSNCFLFGNLVLEASPANFQCWKKKQSSAPTPSPLGNNNNTISDITTIFIFIIISISINSFKASLSTLIPTTGAVVYYSSHEAGWIGSNAFDGSTDTQWVSSFDENGQPSGCDASPWVVIQLPSGVYLLNYTMRSKPDDDYVGQRPRSWTLQGSKDGENWQLIDSRSGINVQYGEYEVSGGSVFDYYRFSFTENNGWRNEYNCPAFAILEIELYGQRPSSSGT